MMVHGGVSKALAGILVIVLLVVAAALVLFLFPGTPPSNPTTSAISTPANLVAAVQQTPQTACGGQSYSNSSLAINWENLAPGTEGIQYLCLKNTGTTPVTLAVTSTLPPSIGKVTSPQTGSVLNGKGIIQVELDLWIPSSAQPGPISTFTITVGPMGAKG